MWSGWFLRHSSWLMTNLGPINIQRTPTNASNHDPKAELPVYNLMFFNRGPKGYFWIKLRYSLDLWSAKNVIKQEAFRSKLSSCSCQCTDIMHVWCMLLLVLTPDEHLSGRSVFVCVWHLVVFADKSFTPTVSNCWKAAKGHFIAGLFWVHSASGWFHLP